MKHVNIEKNHYEKRDRISSTPLDHIGLTPPHKSKTYAYTKSL